MKNSFNSAQVEQLRRDAKRLARTSSVALNIALDQIAATKGFRNWSLLVKHSSAGKGESAIEKRVAAPDIRPRYYLHGDQVEADPFTYFCAQCDLFVDAAHFESNHGAETYERALQSIDRWAHVAAESSYRRPKNATNLLETEARRRRAAKEESRSSFHRWLQGQKDRASPVGDFARDVFGDSLFPANSTRLSELITYLETRHADPAAVRALRQAWSEFSKGN